MLRVWVLDVVVLDTKVVDVVLVIVACGSVDVVPV